MVYNTESTDPSHLVIAGEACLVISMKLVKYITLLWIEPEQKYLTFPVSIAQSIIGSFLSKQYRHAEVFDNRMCF